VSSPGSYLALSPSCHLKWLETPCLFDAASDDLYELSADAAEFLMRCHGGERVPAGGDGRDFARTLVNAGLASWSATPAVRPLDGAFAPRPSLRYLELLLTDRCNLSCRHCYLGDGGGTDLPTREALSAAAQLAEMSGLRLLLSGGEPLLHPGFWEVNEALPDLPLRTVLLTNGTLIDPEVARRLMVREAQVSIDGLKDGHEALRGAGSFDAAWRGIDALLDVGIPVAVATMIHRGNLREFEGLSDLLDSRGIAEWTVDVPCAAGRLARGDLLAVTPEEAGPLLALSRGGGLHASEGGHACGAHLAAVLPDGRVAKCGFYADESVGSLREGLRACWGRIPRPLLADLRCDCPELASCRGGCRYRAALAGDAAGPDPYQCEARGIALERR
jgi:radical SAM protein with 4Fe4S-binding SPASM domain